MCSSDLDGSVLPQEVGQFLGDGDQFLMLVKILDRLGLGKRVIKSQFLRVQPQRLPLPLISMVKRLPNI